MIRVRELTLALGIAGTLPPSVSHAQLLDSFVDERRACRGAQESGRLEEAYDCVQRLWNDHASEMDVPGKIETLQQMAELYIVSSEPREAQKIYEYVLATLDNAWRPDDFEYQPTAWRETFLAAQAARGITGNPTAMRNIALLDFVVATFGDQDMDLMALEKTLPMYVTTRLQEVVEASEAGRGEGALRVIPSRDREALMREIGEMAGAEPGAPTNEATAPLSVLVSAGRLHAIHAFVKGTIIFTTGENVQIAIQLIPTERANVVCPVTAGGRTDELFSILGDALDELLACAFDVAADTRVDAHVGPTRATARALRHLHEALVLQERGDLDGALKEARAAEELLGDDPAVRDLIAGLTYQKERVKAQREPSLPAPPAFTSEGG